MNPKRIAVIASEVLGMSGTGGAATADSLLAIALGRSGHDVDLVVAPGRETDELSDTWRQNYADAGVQVRPLSAGKSISPRVLEPTATVLNALRDDPPDVVIGDDWRGVGFAPLRARQLGLAFGRTSFVVHCHAPGTLLAEFARKVPDRAERFGEEVAERTAVGLADAAVSPSQWLLDWMAERRWPTPRDARVIPHVWLTTALGIPPMMAPHGMPVRRLAFFGQIREGKGVGLFLDGINALEPSLLDGVELVFVGRLTRRWTAERIVDTLEDRTAEHLAAIRFETTLDPLGALEELRRPGTLTIVPSLLDNAPYTVSECIEHSIPCLAAGTGGTPELIAEEDRERVLFEPTASSLAAGLTGALESRDGVAPARSATDPAATVEAWLDLVESLAPPSPRKGPRADRVAVIAGTEASADRAARLAETTRSADVEVIRAASRRAGAEQTSAEWVVFLDDDDDPDDGMLDRLVLAQAASQADAVTTGVRPSGDPDGVRLFLGAPAALGLVENQFGVIGLLRRDLALPNAVSDDAADPDWLLFARIALAGAEIVSIPEPLSTYAGKPGDVGDVPGDGLAVLRAYEEQPRSELLDLPQLAATLAAAHARLERPLTAPVDARHGSLAALAARVRGSIADGSTRDVLGRFTKPTTRRLRRGSRP